MEEASAAQRRDKRRNNIAARLRSLNEIFEQDRNQQYSELLDGLRRSLYTLHAGTDTEYLEKLGDLEEFRDNRLMELFLWAQYQTNQADRQYQEDVEYAKSNYELMLHAAKDKLRARLEQQRKRLFDDRSLLDISTDHSFFLAAANPGSLGNHHTPSTRAAVAAVSSGLSAAERRNLRRRDYTDEVSGISGNEGSGPSRRGNRGGTAGGSDTDTAGAATDREIDAVFKDFDTTRPRHTTKSYQGVKTLKYEEGLQDIAAIHDEQRKLNRYLR